MDLQVDKQIAQFESNNFGNKENDSNDSENELLPYKLTISEYEEIAQRHDDSLKQLVLVKDAVDTPENLKALRSRIERECEQITLRVIILKKQITRESQGQVTDVYKITIVNLGRNGFLLLKRHKNR